MSKPFYLLHFAFWTFGVLEGNIINSISLNEKGRIGAPRQKKNLAGVRSNIIEIVASVDDRLHAFVDALVEVIQGDHVDINRQLIGVAFSAHKEDQRILLDGGIVTTTVAFHKADAQFIQRLQGH